jgi:hypothetical protein
MSSNRLSQSYREVVAVRSHGGEALEKNPNAKTGGVEREIERGRGAKHTA